METRSENKKEEETATPAEPDFAKLQGWKDDLTAIYASILLNPEQTGFDQEELALIRRLSLAHTKTTLTTEEIQQYFEDLKKLKDSKSFELSAQTLLNEVYNYLIENEKSIPQVSEFQIKRIHYSKFTVYPNYKKDETDDDLKQAIKNSLSGKDEEEDDDKLLQQAIQLSLTDTPSDSKSLRSRKPR